MAAQYANNINTSAAFESAIDDDDGSSEWEDWNEESGRSSVDSPPKLSSNVDSGIHFKRVDSTANLKSRRSLITVMLAHDNNNVHRNARGVASQSTSGLPRDGTTRRGPNNLAPPNDSDEAPLVMRAARPPHMRSINEIPRSAAQPIMTNNNVSAHQTMLSPKTTRRHMLATELTESLRRHMLWERSLNAVRRQHTSQYPGPAGTLRQQPDKPYMKKDQDGAAASTWEDFNREACNGYHSQGW